MIGGGEVGEGGEKGVDSFDSEAYGVWRSTRQASISLRGLQRVEHL